MPIYEYECTSCTTVFEIFQRITEDPLTSCPECSGPVRKLMSASSFQLKGGGWYADGYSSKNSNESGSGATKTENKPEKTESTAKSTSDTTASKSEATGSAASSS